MRLLWFTSAAVLALVAGGCGESKPTLAPVRGHVYFHGVPLAGGAIVFTPDPDRGGHSPLACARIGADGAYVLVTGPDPGAVVGWHRVTLQARVPDCAGGDAAAAPLHRPGTVRPVVRSQGRREQRHRLSPRIGPRHSGHPRDPARQELPLTRPAASCYLIRPRRFAVVEDDEKS